MQRGRKRRTGWRRCSPEATREPDADGVGDEESHIEGTVAVGIYKAIRIVIGVGIAVEGLGVLGIEAHGIDGEEAPDPGVVPAGAEVLDAEVGLLELAGVTGLVRGGWVDGLAVRRIGLAPHHAAFLIGRGDGRAQGVVMIMDNLLDGLGIQAQEREEQEAIKRSSP